MGRNWFAAMSGVPSVPLAILAYFIPSETAKILLGLTAFVSVWIAAYLVWSTERKAVIALQDAADERDQKKQQLLDDIASLRNQMVQVRIEIEQDIGRRQYDDGEWNRKFAALEQTIASKIEQFSTKAEADTYRNRGNIPRPTNPVMGGSQNSVLLDVCIYDLDYLKQFIIDYSRQKQRP